MQFSCPTIEYYESDYPSETLSRFPENFDATTEYQGIRYDVGRYCDIAGNQPISILELCCGSGRVGIPLARAGHQITGVDISEEMLGKFKQHIITAELQDSIQLIQSDIAVLDLPKIDFDLCIIPFNSLLLLSDFESQLTALTRAACHLRPDGEILIDIVNPMHISNQENNSPKPFFTRRHPDSGNRYTRFAARSGFDVHQRQALFGWYDEILQSGLLRRQHYEFFWRPIFRFELELMLSNAGFQINKIEGGHCGEPFQASSHRMFVRAIKR